MNISIQKIEGYEVGHYLITGGPEPKIITKQMVLDSLRQLNSQLDIQNQLVAKIEQLELHKTQTEA